MRKILINISEFFKESDILLMLFCLISSFLGSLIVLSSTLNGSGYQKFIVQCAGIGLGLIIAIIISIVDYQKPIKYGIYIAIISVGLVILTFFFGFAPSGTDDKAWLSLPFNQSFQPSELLKIAFIITFTKHITSLKEKDINRPLNLLLLCVHGAVPVLLIHFQGDDGTTLVLFIIFLVLMLVGGVKIRYFAIAGGALVAVLPILWFFIMNQQQKERVLALIYPDQYAASIYQQTRSELAIGSGGFFGTGLFKGPCVQGGLIPLGLNDFIFASAGEELGFFGCIIIIALLFLICLRIVKTAKTARDKQGKLLCMGVFAIISAQTIINLGMVLSIIPVIGITLPFYSAGGTSLITLFIGIGLVLSVYKHKNINKLVVGL